LFCFIESKDLKPKTKFMKAISLIFLTVLLILFGCTAPQETAPDNPLVGAWQMISRQTFSGDTLQMELGKDFTASEMKIWSESHYAFIGRYQMDTTSMDNGGGGSYRIEGTHYEEMVEYFPYQGVVGTTVRILLEIKGDTLIQTWPADENWEITADQYNIMKMIRLD
jgi:hypothetical protein